MGTWILAVARQGTTVAAAMEQTKHLRGGVGQASAHAVSTTKHKEHIPRTLCVYCDACHGHVVQHSSAIPEAARTSAVLQRPAGS